MVGEVVLILTYLLCFKVPGNIAVSITPNLHIIASNLNTDLNCAAIPPNGLQSGQISYTYQWSGPEVINDNTQQQVTVGTAGTYTCEVTGTSDLPFVNIINPTSSTTSTLHIASKY